MRGWKRLCAAAALLICIMAAVGGTLAWSTGGDRATNVVTTGAVEIRIVQGGAAQTVEYDPEWRGMLPGSAAARAWMRWLSSEPWTFPIELSGPGERGGPH